MVGLVVVSHSRALAEALVELVGQAAGTDLPVASAGGVGDERRQPGTDATDVAAAIRSVYTDKGVVVLMDMGSAVLSAETALDFLDPQMRSRIRFCDAPIVEGAIAAGIQISLDSDLTAVCRAARSALMSKTEQLSPNGAAITETVPAGMPADAGRLGHHRQLTVRSRHGLHARPAARFVRTAAAFDADVRVKKHGSLHDPIPATSFNRLLTLGAVCGDDLSVSAAGPQASEALDALQRLMENDADDAGQTDPEPDRTACPESAGGGLAAVASSDGIAIGPLFRFRQPLPSIPVHRVQDPEAEWHRLLQALATVKETIGGHLRRTEALLNTDQAAIFDAHRLILEDPDLLAQARQRIYRQGHNAALAWHGVIEQAGATYLELTDDYLKERRADLMDVGRQVLLALLGVPATAPPQLAEPAVIIARALTPNQTAGLDLEKVLGLITVTGGPTAHTAILARAMGIPAVSGVHRSILSVADYTPVAMDGFRGRVWIDPSEAVLCDLKERRNRWQAHRKALFHGCRRPAVTGDGHRVTVAANIGLATEAGPAVGSGAEAVGLLRTEFLFMGRRTPPGESEQADALIDIAGTMGDRPVRVRTLDVGGDKKPPCLDCPDEANPLLGLRAIRWLLRHPDLFQTQLRAILRAAAAGDVGIMFPMIGEKKELDRALAHLAAAHRALVAAHTPHRWPISTGIMIETPGAALLGAAFAGAVDFFSVGTNDLAQYTLAVERDNPELADGADGLHPAVLNLVDRVVRAAHAQKKPVSVCGEMAADPAGAVVLIGLGVDALSVNPAAIPPIKAMVRSITRAVAADLACRALHAADAPAVRRLAADYLTQVGFVQHT